jgi:TonB family protein
MPRVWVVLIFAYSVALHAQNNTHPEVRSAAGNAATNRPPSTPDSTALEFIHVVEPAYPLDAVKRKLQALVTLKVIVSEAGDGDSETVISGNPDLAQAAVDAVKKWKFKPFIRNARPARVSVILPFDFIFVDEAIAPHPKTGTGSSPASFPNTQAMKIIWVATRAAGTSAEEG